MTYTDIIYYMSVLEKEWGADGRKVVEKCYGAPLNMSFDDFLKECTACGGDWGGMLLTGIKRLRPEVWEAIPNKMGTHAWICLCAVLGLLVVRNK